MKTWIVWNEAHTEGFVTTDEGLAYEVRKSASSNCYTAEGEPSPVAIAFCERWYEDNCTMEEIANWSPPVAEVIVTGMVRVHGLVLSIEQIEALVNPLEARRIGGRVSA